MSGRISEPRLCSRPTEHGPFGILVIAASLGGISALGDVLAGLATDFPLPILVCQHVLRDRPSLLATVLGRRTGLRIAMAADGDLPTGGTVHVAPPDRHLMVHTDGLLKLSEEARINFCRPSADVLFRSVAASHGPRALAVVLTGRGRDGAQGVAAIRQRGGFAIAQDEASSEAFDMPLAARDIGQADLMLPLRQIPGALRVLTAGHDLAFA
jgi:two-component system chemotaxis response regulator CheB